VGGTVLSVVGGACLGVGISRTLITRRRPDARGGVALACVGALALVVGLILSG
jgi:hypothetical protein